MGAKLSSLNSTSESGDVMTSQVIAIHSESTWSPISKLPRQWPSKWMVVDFTAMWCGPCRWMEPAVNEFAEKFPDVEFIRIDMDKLVNVATQYGVEALPTFLFIRNGRVVDKIVGAEKSELQKKVELHKRILISY